MMIYKSAVGNSTVIDGAGALLLKRASNGVHLAGGVVVGNGGIHLLNWTIYSGVNRYRLRSTWAALKFIWRKEPA